MMNMVMAEQKKLQELLSEEQEPFLLEAYISHKQTQFSNKHKHKHKSIWKKSPIINYQPTPLLQAALRIHNHYSSSSKPHQNDTRFGAAFSSFFSRLINPRGTANNNNNNNNNPNLQRDVTLQQSQSPAVALTCSTTPLSHSHSHDAFFPFSLHHSSPIQEKEISNNGEDSIDKFQPKEEEEEEEEKEQCSPVSVLDPPFEDDDYDEDDGNDYEEGGFDYLECSYANVQRTKKHLLQRLLRFEELAELDPLELEKRMLDQEDEECQTFIDEEDDCEDDSIGEASCEEKGLGEITHAILHHSSLHGKRRRVPKDLRRLVSDLVAEEEVRQLGSSDDRDMVMERVCRRLELWEEVDSNTIDMMVDEDLSREESLWKKNAQVGELAMELELVIFGFLVEEFAEELASSNK